MSFDLQALAILGAAVAAPSLAERAAPKLAQVGITIPVYLTAGQKAAIAALDGTSSVTPSVAGVETTHDQVFSRYLEARKQLAATYGTLSDGHTPKCSTGDYNALARALLAATKAGYDAADEPYQVTDDWNGSGKSAELASQGFGGGTYADLVPVVRKAVWEDLSSASSLNALGDAVAAVRGRTNFLTGGWSDALEEDADLQAAFGDLASLALEMDGQGYRIQGPPFTYSISEGVAAAGSFWEKAAKDGLFAALGLGLDALEALVFSTPGLVIIGGALVVWRVL